MQSARVPAINGWQWIVGGFQLFRQSPVLWIVLFLIYLLVGMGLSILPVIGPILLNLFAPVFIAGFMLGCRALDAGEDLEINHLFAGFKHNSAQLITVGGIYLAGMLLVAGVILLSGGSEAMSVLLSQQDPSQPPPAPSEDFLLASLLGLSFLLPLVMAYWFAPPLVLFHNLGAVAAMKASLAVCLQNWRAFLIYSVVSVALMVLAVLPFGLGLLVMIPTMTASLYVSYKDIFGAELAESPAES